MLQDAAKALRGHLEVRRVAVSAEKIREETFPKMIRPANVLPFKLKLFETVEGKKKKSPPGK